MDVRRCSIDSLKLSVIRNGGRRRVSLFPGLERIRDAWAKAGVVKKGIAAAATMTAAMPAAIKASRLLIRTRPSTLRLSDCMYGTKGTTASCATSHKREPSTAGDEDDGRGDADPDEQPRVAAATARGCPGSGW